MFSGIVASLVAVQIFQIWVCFGIRVSSRKAGNEILQEESPLKMIPFGLTAI